jgi:DNA-binding response OmpR family regulator
MKRVLIVDDEAAILEGVGRVLTRQGFEVVKAPSGQACLEELRRGFKGVILMDIMMPGLDGWQTIQAMVAENLLSGVLICMLTAKPSPGSGGRGLEQWVFDYLPKPFENAELARRVDIAAGLLDESA